MKSKKIITMVLVAILCFASSVTAFAAGLTAEEQVILDKLNAGVEVNGVVVQVPVDLINQVENEFLKNKTDITPDQATLVTDTMDEIITYAKAEDLTTLDDLKASISVLLPIVQEAAEAAGYTIEYDAAISNFSVSNEAGNTVYTSKEVINQTGFDLTATVFVGGVLVTLLAACIVVTNKKKLFVKVIEA